VCDPINPAPRECSVPAAPTFDNKMMLLDLLTPPPA
jgi:hypothetical protein